MKRWVFVLILTVTLITWLPHGRVVFAEDVISDYTEELLEELDVSELEAYLQSLLGKDLPVRELIAKYITGDYNVDYDSFLQYVGGWFFSAIRDLAPTLVAIVSIFLLSGILNLVKGGVLADGVQTVIRFASTSAVLTILLTHLIELIGVIKSTIGSIQTEMQVLFPILLTLLSSSGGTVSVAVFRPAVLFLSEAIVSVYSSLLLPVAIVILILSVLQSLSPSVRLLRTADLLKSSSRWIIGLSVAVFSVFLSVQGITSAVYDGVSMRAFKYAIGSSVPMVGGFVSGGFDLVVAGSILIKNAVGIGGVVLLLWQIALPLVKVASLGWVIKLAAAIGEPLGDVGLSALLGTVASDLGYFTAILCCVGLLFFVTVLLLVCSTGAFL